MTCLAAGAVFFRCGQVPDTDPDSGISRGYDTTATFFSSTRLMDFDLRNTSRELDSLRRNFVFKKQELNGSSYYHKTWWAQYSIARDAIMAGVDSTGNFFLISNLRGGSTRHAHDGIELSIDGESHVLKSTGLDSVHLVPMLCACTWEVQFYNSPGALLLATKMRDCKKKSIAGKFLGIVDRKFVIGSRDLGGILDCLELSELIRDSIQINSELTLRRQGS
jgi:hypothetical protein